MRVSLFITCLADMVQPEIAEATVKVLRACGAEVSCPLDQTCCGQPAWNSGFIDQAAKVAKNTLNALDADGADAIVVPAGSCATMMKIFWPEMFERTGDHRLAEKARQLASKTFEFSEFVDARRKEGALPDVFVHNPAKIAYHHSCHMLRELHIESSPLNLLEAMGEDVVQWPDAQRCCGFGGLFSVKLPETSVAMADEKLASIPSDVDMLVGCDGSCLMHLRSRVDHLGKFLPVRHLAEILADALDQSNTPLAPQPHLATGVTQVEGDKS